MILQKVFFSYSRNDAADFAVRLAQDLGKASFDVWIDQQDIRAGMEWDLEIEKALESCDCLLFIESEKSVVSNNVLDEVYYALGQNKKVIPVIYHDSKTPFRLRRLQHIDFTKEYQAGLDDLLGELRGDHTNRQPITVTAAVANAFNFKNTRTKRLLLLSTLGVLGAIVILFLIFNRIETISANSSAASGTIADSGSVQINPIHGDTAQKPGTGNILSVQQEEQKVSTAKIQKVKPVVKQKKLPVGSSPNVEALSSAEQLLKTFTGNWRLVKVLPAPASHRGYIKIERVDDRQAKIVSSFQFYFKNTNAEARFVVFNGFASCASCILKNEVNMIEKDLAIGTNRYTILKKDVPGEGKAGDTTATIGGNSSLSAAVKLQLLNKKTIVIKVLQPDATNISNGFTVPPFNYIFQFEKDL